METVLAATEPSPHAIAVPEIDLYAFTLKGRAARTARAYGTDYEDFARFLGVASAPAALDALTRFSHATACWCALSYREHLEARKLAPATVARRLAALRSACILAKRVGRMDWELDVESPKTVAYRDTSGPGHPNWLKILERAKQESTTPKGRRDLLILRLLHDLGLRRGEVIGLDLADAELPRQRIAITGKGRTQREFVSLPKAAAEAMAAWIKDRGEWDGPLFIGLDTGSVNPNAGRLTGEGVRLMVASVARRSGVSECRPHGLRHAAVTEALARTNGDIRRVAKFSRHRKVETVLRYDDNREDLGGQVASLISED